MDTATLNDDAPHIYLTVADDDESEVLELVKSDATGMYIRDNGTWWKIDLNDDNPRVWDRIIIDVSEGAAEAFDQAQEERGDDIRADVFNEYLVEDDEELSND